jgi:hypothetical protein
MGCIEPKKENFYNFFNARKVQDALKGEMGLEYCIISQVPPPPTDFILTVDTTLAGTASDTIELRLGIADNITIDWGDTNTDPGVVGINSHTYSSGGIYQITISGDDVALDQTTGGSTDDGKIISVDNSGIFSFTAFAFNRCINLVSLPSSGSPQSISVNLSKMFTLCTSLVVSDDWTAYPWPATITTFSDFANAATGGFNPILPSTLVFSGNVGFAFKNTIFDGTNASGWGTSGVTIFSGMFQGSSINFDFTNWRFDNATALSLFVSNTSNLTSANYNSLLAALRATA